MGKRLSVAVQTLRDEQYQKGYHYCTKCRQFKPIGEFRRQSDTRYGLGYWCTPCWQSVEHTEQWRQRGRESKRAIAAKFVALAGGACQRCGYDRCVAPLDFHHVNPAEKADTPQHAMTLGHETAYQELDKCVLLCANCHREYHFGAWIGDFVKRDGLGWTV